MSYYLPPTYYDEEEALRQAIEDSLVTKSCENDLREALELSKTYEEGKAAYNKVIQEDSDRRMAEVLKKELEHRDDHDINSWTTWRLKNPV